MNDLHAVRSVWSLLALLLLLNTSAQEDARPKVGLVLSGGGAKGICHIGVLKVLEEEGIRPDLITGTSMGSLVGGLYACGYSADDIERIVLGIRWDELMTNKVGLDKIAIEEKRYYGRWLAELPWDHGPKLPSGLIRGQKIMELIRLHTLPFHGTEDFRELPIPFACIATDVGAGEALVQDRGFLPDAMRSSMSIPTFFAPMFTDSLLLVDGGEIRNFPVSDARAMGADLVIGVDVGDGLLPPDQLDSPVDILTQSAMFTSLKDTERQRDLCDVLILPDYAPYSTGSFLEEAVPWLVHKGYQAADSLRPQLRELARKAGMGPGPLRVDGPLVPDTLQVDRVEVRADRGRELASSRFKLDHGAIAVADLEERVDLLYGTRHFDLVQYRLEQQEGDSVLVIEAEPAAPGRLGVSLNYDTYHEVSLGVLLLLRDKLFKGSRLAMEAYLGRYPEVDVNYLKYFGPRLRMGLELGSYYESGPAFIRDEQGTAQAEFRQDITGGYARIRTTASRTFSAGIEFQPRRAVLKPRVFATISLNDGFELDLRDIDRIRYSWNRAGVFLQYNDLDQFVYPERGWEVLASGATYMNAVTELRYSEDYLGTLDPELAGILRELASDITEYDDYLRATVEWQGRVPLHRRVSLMFDGAASMADRTDLSGADVLNIGGMRRPDRTSIPFWGLNEYDGGVNDLLVLRGGLQLRFGKNLFWQGATNVLWTGFRDGDLSEVLGDRQVVGLGSTLGLRGMWGLVQVGVSTNLSNDQVLGWFNLGYRL